MKISIYLINNTNVIDFTSFLCYNYININVKLRFGGPMAKIISFSNQKGGVGKTTSCVNIAAQIANKGNKKVLMIDLDPQGNATSGLGLSKSKTASLLSAKSTEAVPTSTPFQAYVIRAA